IAVRNDVMRETEGKQVPWEHSALTGRYYFNRAQAPSAEPMAQSRPSEAAEAWGAVKDVTNVAVLRVFVARYGDTFFAELARARQGGVGRVGGGLDPRQRGPRHEPLAFAQAQGRLARAFAS